MNLQFTRTIYLMHLIGDLLKAIYSIADRLLEKEGNNMWWGTVMQLDRITDKLTLRRLPVGNPV